MNLKSSPILFALGLALAGALPPLLRAEDPLPPATVAPVETPLPVAAQPEADKAKPAPAVEAAQPAAAAAGPAVAEKADGKTVEPGKITPAAEPAESTATEPKAAPPPRSPGRHHSSNDRVGFFRDSTLAAGEEADSVVSILGSSTSAGEVGDAVVSVIGSSTTSGQVGDAVVSVIGDTHVNGGTVGDTAVAVLGSTYVNGHVKGEVVAVLGNVDLGPDAVVDGEVVCIGGDVTTDAKAVVHGGIQKIAIGGHHFNFTGLHAWFAKCFLYARPLAFGENLLWAWWLALACLGFYALVALVAPGRIEQCAQTLEERPGKSILSAVLTLLLTPVAYLLLVLTIFIGIGVVLIPLFSLGLFFAAIFGKVVMLAWLGRRVAKLTGKGTSFHPALAVLVGGLIVLGLYTVPVLGFILYKLLGVLGLGVVLYTLLLSSKRNKAGPAAAAPVAPPPAAEAGLPLAPAVAAIAPPPATVTLPPVVSASTLERAGFWLRLGAAVLDAVMVGILFGMLHRLWGGFGGVYPFWYAVYCVTLWATKGTTIGGIICGLKLVRLDDRPVDWGVAIVRGLSAFLSLVFAGLGFIWVSFDDEKQSWHDKIAGTTIVRVPKGTSLL